MSSGASKLGQQAPGQRSIFGGNAMPGFVQTPFYKPVTRAEPGAAEQPAQDFGNASQPPAAPSYQPQPQPAPQSSSSPGVFYSGPAQGSRGCPKLPTLIM